MRCAKRHQPAALRPAVPQAGGHSLRSGCRASGLRANATDAGVQPANARANATNARANATNARANATNGCNLPDEPFKEGAVAALRRLTLQTIAWWRALSRTLLVPCVMGR